jgi:uncharacterized protein YutE (UPF0331/DUF86 family)
LVVDRDLVEARVREIHDAVRLLEELTARGFEELTLHEKLSMRYLVIQLVEAAASICVHLLAEGFDERAESYPGCFARLGELGIVPRDLAARLAAAARLRNLLVHRYWAIDDRRVYESVREGLRDFEEFAKLVRRVLEGWRA